jgi:hypothetical protein
VELSIPDGYDRFRQLARAPIHTLAHASAGIRDQLHGGAAVVPTVGDAVGRDQAIGRGRSTDPALSRAAARHRTL